VFSLLGQKAQQGTDLIHPPIIFPISCIIFSISRY
jgi:hypothetical protein